jgi:hypothetical protein
MVRSPQSATFPGLHAPQNPGLGDVGAAVLLVDDDGVQFLDVVRIFCRDPLSHSYQNHHSLCQESGKVKRSLNKTSVVRPYMLMYLSLSLYIAMHVSIRASQRMRHPLNVPSIVTNNSVRAAVVSFSTTLCPSSIRSTSWFISSVSRNRSLPRNEIREPPTTFDICMLCIATHNFFVMDSRTAQLRNAYSPHTCSHT